VVRREQARTIAADAAGTADLVVVAGDFNGTAGARELTEVGFAWLTKDVHNTLGPFDLDHLLVRGLCPGRTAAVARARDLTNASDHAPAWAVVRPCATAATYFRDRASRVSR
jgi:endonuclease/exonuclease/phosphatase family metal-dependent hydrolase